MRTKLAKRELEKKLIEDDQRWAPAAGLHPSVLPVNACTVLLDKSGQFTSRWYTVHNQSNSTQHVSSAQIIPGWHLLFSSTTNQLFAARHCRIDAFYMQMDGRSDAFWLQTGIRRPKLQVRDSAQSHPLIQRRSSPHVTTAEQTGDLLHFQSQHLHQQVAHCCMSTEAFSR